jgi:predicted GNAT family acetyltransferase
MSASPEVRENTADQRFEVWVDGELAGMTVYEGGGGNVVPFVHTEVSDRFGGQGLGSILIRQALDTVRSRGQAVLPYCPFVKAFIQKHPDYVDLVPPTERATFDLPTDVPAAEVPATEG